MSGQSVEMVRPRCLPGCTVEHATKVSGCEVTTQVGTVQSNIGEPDLVVRSYVAAEGSLRFTEIGLSVADDEPGDIVLLNVDQAQELAALLLTACDKAAQIAAGVAEQAGGSR